MTIGDILLIFFGATILASLGLLANRRLGKGRSLDDFDFDVPTIDGDDGIPIPPVLYDSGPSVSADTSIGNCDSGSLSTGSVDTGSCSPN